MKVSQLKLQCEQNSFQFEKEKSFFKLKLQGDKIFQMKLQREQILPIEIAERTKFPNWNFRVKKLASNRNFWGYKISSNFRVNKFAFNWNFKRNKVLQLKIQRKQHLPIENTKDIKSFNWKHSRKKVSNWYLRGNEVFLLKFQSQIFSNFRGYKISQLKF